MHRPWDQILATWPAAVAVERIWVLGLGAQGVHHLHSLKKSQGAAGRLQGDP